LFKEVHLSVKSQKQTNIKEKATNNVIEKLTEIVTKKEMRAKSIAELEKLEQELLE